MHDALQEAKKALQAAQAREEAAYNKGRHEQEFEVGQKVLLNSVNLCFKPAGVRKLHPKWIGPFTVVPEGVFDQVAWLWTGT